MFWTGALSSSCPVLFACHLVLVETFVSLVGFLIMSKLVLSPEPLKSLETTPPRTGVCDHVGGLSFVDHLPLPQKTQISLLDTKYWRAAFNSPAKAVFVFYRQVGEKCPQ